VTAVLVAWIGQTDLDCANGRRPGPGPIGSVVAARSFDALVLLSNYAPPQNRAFVDWLAELDAPPVHLTSSLSPVPSGPSQAGLSFRLS